MIDSISLYYFSGTGNTEKITLSLYPLLRKSVSSCSVFRMEDHLKGTRRPVLQNSIIGLLFPVYYNTIPRIVADFISCSTFARKTMVFLIAIPSDCNTFNKTALLSADKMVQNKEGIVFHHSLIPMPSNIKQKYPDGISLKLHSAAQSRLPRIARNILSLKEKRISFNILHHGYRLASLFHTGKGSRFGRNLKVSSDCILCGSCIRHCPTKNIRMDLGVKFSKFCTQCMRCIYNCPAQAISPSFMKKLSIPGGYDLESSINSSFTDNVPSIQSKTYPRNIDSYIQLYSKY